MSLSIPNLLTYSRIAAVAVIVVCLLLPSETARWIALIVFLAAAFTDWLDGHLARAWQQTSALGRMLDPIADKLIVGVTLLMLAADGTIYGINLIAAAMILCREIFVSGLREFLGGQGVVVPVTWLAKWKTGVQLTALAVLIAVPFGPGPDWMVRWFGLVLLWLSALMTVYTAVEYARASSAGTNQTGTL